MPRFKLTIEYDGTGLAGWQRQVEEMSIETLLADAVEKLSGARSEVVGAGRTDAGVHAAGQVAHVDIDKDISAYNVMHGINYHLAPLTQQVIVIKAEAVDDKFHARFSASLRSYRYRIINRQARLALERDRAWHIPETLNVETMQLAAKLLIGHWDFSSFRSSACQSKSPMKTLDRLDIIREGEEITVFAEARSFLHHQVRNMVGSLRMVGNGKWPEHRISDLLKAKDRRQAGETAPACGLTLVNVSYDN
jgi:tRNA pseudouridine38-40 synthase